MRGLCLEFENGDVFDVELVQSHIERIILCYPKQTSNPQGEILKYEFLEPLKLSQIQLARAMGISRVRIKKIILGKLAVTPDTAFRMAKFLMPLHQRLSYYLILSIKYCIIKALIICLFCLNYLFIDSIIRVDWSLFLKYA